jgi:TatD DNase family protein
MRGKPCEPAYVVHTAKRVAELRKTSLEELAPILWQNAERRLRRTFS